MANDQLTWDQLLKKAESDAAENASRDASPSVAPSAAPAVAPVVVSVVASGVEPLEEPAFAREPEFVAGGRVSQASESGSGSPARTPAGKTKRKSTRKTKTKSESSSLEEQLFAKKNWAPLEMNPKPTLHVASTDTGKESGKTALASSVVNEPAEFDEPTARKSKEPDVMTVSELNKQIKNSLEGQFPLFWLKGEISNFKAHTSGHFYFSLKDSKAQISAVMFRGFNGQLRFRPEDGMEVLVRGKVTVYEPRGNYQIFCELMEPVGAGALQKAYEQLKSKLQKEGLFDAAKKRALPALPRHIAIVTSPTGAAIRDMLNVLGRRFKGARITVIPCKVQGDQAPKEIVNAIEMANRLKDVDVMIIGRGGGSIEDLWAFNDERVARAIAGARVPTISAVGHEVDFTIADFVADLRAPTPSAAAELVVKNASDLADRVTRRARAMRLSMLQTLESSRDQLTHLRKRLVDPQRKLQDASLRCDELYQRLQQAVLRSIDMRETVDGLGQRLAMSLRNAQTRKREKLARLMAVLDSLSPLKVLDRGFSMVLKGSEIMTDAAALRPGDTVTVRMAKGQIEASVTKSQK